MRSKSMPFFTDTTLGCHRHARAPIWVALMLMLAGCGLGSPAPGPQTVAGLTPVGTVELTETFVSGVAGGSGTLSFRGKTYPFKLAGAIVGPGFAAERIRAEGDVYNLAQLADFAGAYRQSTGHRGLNTSSTSDLWLENKAGVVMHLTGTQQGGGLSLGRDEILIRLNQ